MLPKFEKQDEIHRFQLTPPIGDQVAGFEKGEL